MSAEDVADGRRSSEELLSRAAPVVVLPPGLEEALEASRSAVKSGQVLWREGQVADAYVHVRDGLAALAAAWGQASAAQAPRALGDAGYRHAATLDRVLRRLAEVPAPRANDDYGRAHERLFESAWSESARLAAFTAGLLRTPAQQRRRRLSYAALLVVTLIGVVAVAVRIRTQPLVTASGVYSSEFPASFAVDGLDATEWLLPGATGWLELELRAPRRIRGVRLRNSHNRHYMDRGTHTFRVTAFAGADAVATADGAFDPLAPDAPEREVALDARGVTRLRVEVLSSYGASGGLAEVTVRGP